MILLAPGKSCYNSHALQASTPSPYSQGHSFTHARYFGESPMNHQRKSWSIPVALIWGAAALFYIVEWMQRVMPTLLVEPISQSMGISQGMLGTVFSVYFYAYAIMQVPAGLCIDYFGPRRVLTVAAILVTLGIACFAASVSLTLLFVGRILIGIGSAFAFTGCIKITKIWFKKRWFPLMVSLTNSVGMLGALFGLAPLTHLVSQVGWRVSLWSSVILTFAVACLLFICIRDQFGRYQFASHVEGANAFKALAINFSKVARVPKLWLIGAYAGLMQVPIIAYAELWAVPYLTHADHLSKQAASTVNSFIFLGIFIGGPIFGFIFKNQQWVRTVLFIANIGVLATLYFLFFYQTEPRMLLSGLSFLLGFFTVSMLISYTWASGLFSDRYTASAVSFTNMIGVMIGGFFQSVIGWLFPSSQLMSHYYHAFSVLVICSVASLMVMLLVTQLLRNKTEVIA
jgi:MFS family permease